MSDWDDIPVTEVSASGTSADFNALSAAAYEEVLVLACRLTIVADATVATRELTLRVDNSAGNPIWRPGGVDATAGQTRNVSFAPGVQYQNAPPNGDDALFPLPEPCIVPASGRIRIEVSAGQAGDAITTRLLVKRRRYLKS